MELHGYQLRFLLFSGVRWPRKAPHVTWTYCDTAAHWAHSVSSLGTCVESTTESPACAWPFWGNANTGHSGCLTNERRCHIHSTPSQGGRSNSDPQSTPVLKRTERAGQLATGANISYRTVRTEIQTTSEINLLYSGKCEVRGMRLGSVTAGWMCDLGMTSQSLTNFVQINARSKWHFSTTNAKPIAACSWCLLTGGGKRDCKLEQYTYQIDPTPTKFHWRFDSALCRAAEPAGCRAGRASARRHSLRFWSPYLAACVTSTTPLICFEPYPSGSTMASENGVGFSGA